MDFRIGFGYDVHRLALGRKLILGGVELPSEKGLLGHSDADVLLHAIMDAVLGALALGDIGKHFPDTETRYKDISSLSLLDEVFHKMDALNYTVGNIDCTVVLERPKIKDFIPEMQRKIASALHTDISRISIKATTSEGLGFAGTGEGAVAYAVALVIRT